MMTNLYRLSPLRRGLSALLALLYVAVALGAARHAGEHDESALEWLPERFHHHDFQIAERSTPRIGVLDLCVACHFSSLRLGNTVPSFELDSPRPWEPSPPATEVPRRTFPSDRTIRGPPRA